MTRDPRFDILFEPVRIGPVTARNRFYQVPHCTGIGWTQPETLARLRAIKAEGGWAVVSTEETEIHPTADCEPFHEGRLWDDRDLPAMALMADAVHAHGSLAAIEIMHHGGSVERAGATATARMRGGGHMVAQFDDCHRIERLEAKVA